MKRNIRLILCFISFICLIIIYIIIDGKLYYYGLSNFEINVESLPAGLKPNYYGSDVSYPIQGFVIEDGLRFLIIGKNKSHRFDSISFRTKEVIKYGYNENFLIAFIEANNGSSYYIKVFNEFNLHNELRLDYQILNSINEVILNNFKWVEVKQDEEKVNKLVRKRIRILLFLIFIIPLWTIIGWILNQSKNIDAKG